MANRTAKLYIRDKVGYRKAPKKINDLPEGEVYQLFWYCGSARKSKAVGRFADAALVAHLNKEHELRLAVRGTPGDTGRVTKLDVEPEVVYVRDAVRDYLDSVRGRVGHDGYGVSPRTLAAYKKRLDFLLEFDGNTALTEVNYRYFERFRAFLRGRLNTDRYVYNVLQAAVIFFRNRGVVCESRILKETGMGAPKRVESYSPEELNMFFASCTETEKLAFQFFLHSMAREREVAHTEVADLLFEENVLHIQPKPWRKFRLKGKKSGQSARGRKVPMPRQFMYKLKVFCNGKDPHDLLFPNTKGNVEGHFLAWCQQIAKRAELSPKKFGLHKFRKTGATLHYKGAVSVPTISTWLGHESVSVTMAYLDVSDAASDHYVDIVSTGACAAWA